MINTSQKGGIDSKYAQETWSSLVTSQEKTQSLFLITGTEVELLQEKYRNSNRDKSL
jgi:hypothetical protein